AGRGILARLNHAGVDADSLCGEPGASRANASAHDSGAASASDRSRRSDSALRSIGRDGVMFANDEPMPSATAQPRTTLRTFEYTPAAPGSQRVYDLRRISQTGEIPAHERLATDAWPDLIAESERDAIVVLLLRLGEVAILWTNRPSD